MLNLNNNRIGPYYGFAISALAVVGFLTLCRAGLVAMNWDRIATTGNATTILIEGLWVDLVSLSRLYFLPLILFVVFNLFSKGRYQKKVAWLCNVCLSSIACIFVFFEIITPTYIAEYGTRPERKFFEYLDSPAETLEMLWMSFRVDVLVTFAALTLAAILFWKLHKKTFARSGPFKLKRVAATLPVIIALLFLVGRGSLEGKPLHPSQVAFSNDILLNNLPLNSLFSASYAAYRMLDEKHASSLYGHMEEKIIREMVRPSKGVSETTIATKDIKNKKKNLVIILEESLGARYVQALGGKSVAPYMSTLVNQGWWFDAMYATGTRSVRGIEAVVSGFPPTPGRSVVRLVDGQSRFFTIASLLSSVGYVSGFYYGGRAEFDNMKGFTLSNGFDYIFDEKDIVDGTFRSTYGYCDDDVFDAIHSALSTKTDAPNFILNLTTSNHQPFEVPPEAGETKTPTRENAVGYADSALERFIEKAKLAPYWNDTIFLVLADHDAKVADFWTRNDPKNSQKTGIIFPVEGFHIPAVILGGDVPVKRSTFIASQIDLPPTLLSLLDVSAPHPMIGTDLTKVQEKFLGTAIMQFADYHAHLWGEELVVLQPFQPAIHARYANNQFYPKREINNSEKLERTALAYALWPNLVYQKGEYYVDYPRQAIQ